MLSIVMPTRNGSQTIEQQLRAVLSQEWDRPWELVVVDNASTDATPQLVRSYAAKDHRARLLVAGERAGASYARNVGIRAACGDFVAFVDDDDVVGDGWLRAIGDAVVQHDYVAGRVEVAMLNDAAVLGSRNPAQQHQLDHFCGIPVSATPLVAVRRDWLLRAGGFDETLSALEDTELCVRLFEMFGRGPVFCPEAVYHYRLRPDARSIFVQAYRYGYERPHLLRICGHVLEPPPQRVRSAAQEWARLILSAPLSIPGGSRRLAWCRRVGTRLGHLVGSMRFRTCWP